MTVFLLILALAYFGGSYFAYNALRRKYAGIIGVPGSYFILMTVFILIGLIRRIFLGGSGGESAIEMVLTILVMLAGLAYTVLMILRCETLADKLLLPIAAVLIGSGFCIRFIASIVFHVPMESGKVESVSFPSSMRDSSGDIWELKTHNVSWLSITVGKRARAESLALESFQAERPLASADAARNKVCLMSLSFREYASGSRGNFSVNFSATGSRLLNFT